MRCHPKQFFISLLCFVMFNVQTATTISTSTTTTTTTTTTPTPTTTHLETTSTTSIQATLTSTTQKITTSTSTTPKITTLTTTSPKPTTLTTGTTKILTSSTIAPQTTTLKTSTAVVTTHLTTTTTALPTTPTSCFVCQGPPVICEKLNFPAECPLEKQFCINTVSNFKNATRIVNMKCGTRDECQTGWYEKYSSDDKCTSFDQNYIYTNRFDCEFCCRGKDCNQLINPKDKWHP